MKTAQHDLFAPIRKQLHRAGIRFHCSAAMRTRLRILAALDTALTLAWLLLKTTPSESESFVVVAAVTVNAVIAFWLSFGGIVPKERCSFCDALQPNVRHLVAAPAVSVCDGCVGLALGVVTEIGQAKNDALRWQRLYLEALPPHAPLAVSGPLLELVGDADRKAGLRASSAIAHCLRLNHFSQAVTIVSAIPPEERAQSDLMALAVAQTALGRFPEALEATDTLLERKDVTGRAFALVNRVRILSHIFAHQSSDRLAGWLVELAEAQRVAADVACTQSEQLLQFAHITEARVKHLAGDLAGARTAISNAQAMGPLGAGRLLVRARVWADVGMENSARRDAEQVLHEAHPESLLATKAAELLAALNAVPPS